MTEKTLSDRPLRTRRDGWTKARQEEFLLALKEQGTVVAACAQVGMSTTSLYKVQARVRSFAQRCNAALAEVKPRIEQEAMRRAVEGWDEPVFQNGKQVGVKRRYSDGLLRAMLLRENNAPPEKAPEMPIEEVGRILLQRLDRLAALHKRQEAERAAEQARAAAEEADRLRKAGKCP